MSKKQKQIAEGYKTSKCTNIIIICKKNKLQVLVKETLSYKAVHNKERVKKKERNGKGSKCVTKITWLQNAIAKYELRTKWFAATKMTATQR